MAPSVIPSTAGAAIEQAAHQMAQQPAAVTAEPGPQPKPAQKSKAGQDYKGFVAGVFSGMAKVSGTQRALSFIYDASALMLTGNSHSGPPL